MDMIYNQKLKEVFELYKKGNCIASDYAMCRELGLRRSTYSNWNSALKKGVETKISHDVENRIEPQLRPYMFNSVGERKLSGAHKIKPLELNKDKEALLIEIKALRETVLSFERSGKIQMPEGFFVLPSSEQVELMKMLSNMVDLLISKK